MELSALEAEIPAAPRCVTAASSEGGSSAAIGSGTGAGETALSTGLGSGMGGALSTEVGNTTGRGGMDGIERFGTEVMGAVIPVLVDTSADLPDPFIPIEAAANSKAVVVSDGVEDVAACPGNA